MIVIAFECDFRPDLLYYLNQITLSAPLMFQISYAIWIIKGAAQIVFQTLLIRISIVGEIPWDLVYIEFLKHQLL